MNPVKRIVATKWSLPAILRNSVPVLHITGDVRPLLMTGDKLWGALHHDAGKVIKHDGQPAVILTVHDTLRLLQLPNGQRIWVPRPRTTDVFAKDRTRRQFSSGVRQVHPTIHFTGEARPEDYVTVPLDNIYSEIPQDTAKFLRPLGAPETFLTSMATHLTRLMSLHSRLANLHVRLNDMLEAKKEEFYREVVIEHLRKSQLNDTRIAACYDVLVENLPVERVAADRGIRLGDLKQVVGRMVRVICPIVHERLEQVRREAQLAYALEVAQIKEETGLPEAA